MLMTHLSLILLYVGSFDDDVDVDDDNIVSGLPKVRP